MKQEAKTESSKSTIEMIEVDIKKYIGLEHQSKYLTTYHLIGRKYIFRGWIVKFWRDVREGQSMEMKGINKIIVKYSAIFYSKAQKY